VSRRFEAPRLLLSARSLDGVTRASRERLLEIQVRFREPESLAVTLAKAVDAGAEGVLTAPSRALRAALGQLGIPVPLYAVLPVLRPQEIESLDPGVEPLIARHGRAAGLGTRLRMGWTGLTRFSVFRRGDFAARMPVLLESQAKALPRQGLRGVVLASAFTDLALFGGHRRFFAGFPRYVHGRFRAAAGFETAHPGLLLARLREWELTPDFVVGPLNPEGLGMKPAAGETLAELARGLVPFVASEPRAAGACTMEEAQRYAREHHAHGLAPDLTDMDDVAGDLRRLAG
jgi:hypothetical protein